MSCAMSSDGRLDREPLSLLLMDLDGLKRVNDQFGHEAGDAALRSVAAAMRSGLREIDLGAQIGGDEFAVLAPQTDAEAAIVLAERLRALVATAGNGRGGRPKRYRSESLRCRPRRMHYRQRPL